MEWNEVKTEVNKIDILDVARLLGITFGRKNGSYQMCNCFMHEDRNPSLWLRPSTNTWRCEGCGVGGDNIALVMARMKVNFAEAVRWLASSFGIETGRDNAHIIKPKLQKTMQSISLNSEYLKSCYSTESPFCKALVGNGILTERQMRRAALRYHLGATRDGGVIFWQIDRNERLHDGKIMFYRPDCHRDHDRHPMWVVSKLKRQRLLPEDYQPVRCLFGSHLLSADNLAGNGDVIVAIVESEKTAVICSELIPDLQMPVVWLATGGLSNLTVPAISQVAAMPSGSARGSLRLILFPDTDPDGTAYRKWRETAIAAQRELHVAITVSDILELHATDEQKACKIDIADFILSTNPRHHIP